MEVMAISSRRAISSFVNLACSPPPVHRHQHRCSFRRRVFSFLHQSWPDFSLKCSVTRKNRCLRLEGDHILAGVDGVSTIAYEEQQEEWLADGELQTFKDECGLIKSTQVSLSPRPNGEEPLKIWMRKQGKTRALGLNIVEKLSKSNDVSVKSKDNVQKIQIEVASKRKWFPHERALQVTECLIVSSEEVVELLGPFLSEERKQRIERVVDNRTFSVCTVVEGLTDVGNVSAICRTADAMGFQSIHVISNNRTLRYKENQRTSAGAEKWLDMEKWEDTKSCLETLKARGYRIAVTHVADDTVSIHDMDWTIPTAIVLGNEHRGISQDAIDLSDVRCSIPMAGMVESFNVSVAAGILLHHAAVDRISRVGHHGDLSEEERSVLIAVFYMRHKDDSKSILTELSKRKFADGTT